MNKFSLHPDDLPPIQVTLLDELLLRQLAEATGKHFFQACDRITRALLSNCHWYFQVNTSPLTLVIFCYDSESYWHIVNAIPQIINRLKRFSNSSKVRLCPPANKGMPWEVGVDDEDCFSK